MDAKSNGVPLNVPIVVEIGVGPKPGGVGSFSEVCLRHVRTGPYRLLFILNLPVVGRMPPTWGPGHEKGSDHRGYQRSTVNYYDALACIFHTRVKNVTRRAAAPREAGLAQPFVALRSQNTPSSEINCFSLDL